MESITHTRGGLHFLLPTLGSAGDVFPMMELGIALQRRGHHATVVTNEFFADTIRDSGLGFIGLGTMGEAEATLADPRLWHPTKGFECIVERVVAPNISRLYEIVRERSAPDMVVGASALCLGARVAQEHLGIPMASIELQPALLRSLIDAGVQGRLPMGYRGWPHRHIRPRRLLTPMTADGLPSHPPVVAWRRSSWRMRTAHIRYNSRASVLGTQPIRAGLPVIAPLSSTPGLPARTSTPSR